MRSNRQALTVEAAVTLALSLLPPRSIEQFTGKTHHSFAKYANPNSAQRLPFDDAVKLDQALASFGEPPIFGPLFSDLFSAGTAFQSGPAPGPEHVYEAVAATTEAAGDLARGVRTGETVEQIRHRAEAVVINARAVPVALDRMTVAPMRRGAA